MKRVTLCQCSFWISVAGALLALYHYSGLNISPHKHSPAFDAMQDSCSKELVSRELPKNKKTKNQQVVHNDATAEPDNLLGQKEIEDRSWKKFLEEIYVETQRLSAVPVQIPRLSVEDAEKFLFQNVPLRQQCKVPPICPTFVKVDNYRPPVFSRRNWRVVTTQSPLPLGLAKKRREIDVEVVHWKKSFADTVTAVAHKEVHVVPWPTHHIDSRFKKFVRRPKWSMPSEVPTLAQVREQEEEERKFHFSLHRITKKHPVVPITPTVCVRPYQVLQVDAGETVFEEVAATWMPALSRKRKQALQARRARAMRLEKEKELLRHKEWAEISMSKIVQKARLTIRKTSQEAVAAIEEAMSEEETEAHSREPKPLPKRVRDLKDEELWEDLQMRVCNVRVSGKPRKRDLKVPGRRKTFVIVPGAPLPKEFRPEDRILFVGCSAKSNKSHCVAMEIKRKDRKLKEKLEEAREVKEMLRKGFRDLSEAQSSDGKVPDLSEPKEAVQSKPGWWRRARDAVSPTNIVRAVADEVTSSIEKAATKVQTGVKLDISTLTKTIQETTTKVVGGMCSGVTSLWLLTADLVSSATRLVILGVLTYCFVQWLKEKSPMMHGICMLLLFVVGTWMMSPEIKKALGSLQDMLTEYRKATLSLFGDPNGISAAHNSEKVMSTVSSALAMLFAGIVITGSEKGKALEKMCAQVANFPRLRAGLTDVAETVMSWLEDGVNWIREKLKLDRVQLFSKGLIDLDEWVKRCEHFLGNWREKKITLSVASRSVINALIAEGQKLTHTYYRDKKAGTVRGVVNSYLHELLKVMSFFDGANIGNQGVRACPFGVLLVGAPGVGKSLQTMPLINAIITRSLNVEELKMFRDNPDDFLYCRNAEQEFMDGYHGQSFLFIDDLGQIKYNGATPDNEVMNVIRFFSHMPYLCHMADLNSKANTSFRSRFILASSNGIRNIEVDKVINYSEAFERRWHKRIRVTIAPEYALKDNSVDPEDRRLDKTKCKGPFDTKAWNFELMWKTNPKDTRWNIGRVMKWEQLIDYLTKEFADHEALNQKYVDKVNNDRKADIDARIAALTEDCVMLQDQDDADRVDPEEVASVLEPVEVKSTSRLPKKKESTMWQAKGKSSAQGREVLMKKGDFYAKMEKITNEKGVEAQVMKIVEKDPWIELQEKTNAPFVETVRWAIQSFGEFQQYTLWEEDATKIVGRNMGTFVETFLQRKSLPFGDAWLLNEVLPNIEEQLSSILLEPCKQEKIRLEAYDLRVSETKSYLARLEEKYPIASKILTFAPLLLAALGIAFSVWKLYKWWNQPSDANSAHRVGTKRLARLRPSLARKTNASEAQGDSQGFQIASTVVANNMYQIMLEIPDDPKVIPEALGSVTFLRGRTFLVQQHLIDLLRWEIKEGRATLKDTVYLVPFNRITNNLKTVSSIQIPISCLADDFQLVPECGDDLSICQAPLGVATHRDILKFFVTKKDLEDVRQKEVTLWTRKDETLETIVVQTGKATMHKRHRYLAGKNRVPKTYTMPDSFGYDFECQKGDCGSLMFLNDSHSGSRKIAGVHSAGDGTTYGYSVVLTREQIESVLPRSKDEVVPNDDVCGKLSDGQNGVPKELSGFRILSEVKPVPLAGTTKLVPSPLTQMLEEYGYEPKKAPAVLKPVEVNGERVDPLLKAIGKFNGPGNWADLDLVNKAVSMTFLNVEKADPLAVARVFTKEEAIVGLENDPTFGSLTRGTDEGYLWWCERYGLPIQKPGNLPGKKRWFGDEEKFNLQGKECKALFDRIDSCIADAEKGVRNLHIYKLFPKDELRPMEKVLEGKTRPIFGAPLDMFIMFRMYFGAFIQSVTRGRIVNGSAVGVNPFGAESQKLYDLLNDFEKLIAGDFAGYDSTTLYTIIMRICTAINNWYVTHDCGYANFLKTKDFRFVLRMATDNLVRTTLFHEITNAKVLAGRWVIELFRGLPSGHPLTAVLNTLYTNVLFRMLFLTIAPDKAEMYDQLMFLIALGDDHVVAMSGVDIDPVVAAEFFRTIGMDYTMADKSQVRPEFQDISEVVFLKRSFRFEPRIQRQVLQLDLETVLEMPLWRKKKANWQEDLKFTFNEAVKELAGHGTDCWAEWFPRMSHVYQRTLHCPYDSGIGWAQKFDEFSGQKQEW